MSNRSQRTVVEITGLSHDGRGITHVQGKTTFVEGALIGEVLEIEYLKRKGRYDEAKIATIVKPSESRQSPQCSSFDICGGCSLQHIATSAQLTHKQSVLLEQLQHIGGVRPNNLLPAIVSTEYGYRRKARVGVRYVFKKEKLLIGFREKNGRYIADIEECPVLHPSVGSKIPGIREFLLSLEDYLQVPQLEIAIGDEETAIIIRHLAPFGEGDLEKIRHFAAKARYTIYLQPGGTQTIELFYPSNQPPRLSYQLAEYGLEMLFHPSDFTQVNSEVNKQLIALAITLLAPKPHETILDLFCGIGNFTLPISRYCQKVIGVEGSELMVARGYENAAHNGIENVEFRCQNLAENNYTIEKIAPNVDAILLDPPRAGAWDVISNIPSSISRIVYVSCNPATLARDAGHLVGKNGFSLDSVGVLDMFPHTSHVESIALFKRV